MKILDKTFLIATVIFLANMTAFSTATSSTQTQSKRLILDFENVTPYRGVAAVWAGNPKLQDTVVISTTKGVHGNATKFVYNYQGDEVCQYGGFHSWMYTVAEFKKPLDLSNCDGFSYMLRNSKPNDNMSFTFYLRDSQEHWMRIMDNGVLQKPRHEWEERTCALAQAPKEITKPYGHGLQTDLFFADGQAIDLAHIDRIAVSFLDAGLVTKNGTFAIELDDFCIFEGTQNQNIIKSFDFTTSDSVAKWKSIKTTVSLENNALALETTASKWTFKGAEYTLGEPINLKNIAHARIEVEGDSALKKTNTSLGMRLTDVNGNMALCIMFGMLKSNEKHTGFAPLKSAAFPDKDFYQRSCWRLGTFVGNYNDNKKFDLGKVSSVAIGFEAQDTQADGAQTKIKIRKIDLGGTARTPEPEPTPVKK